MSGTHKFFEIVGDEIKVVEFAKITNQLCRVPCQLHLGQ